MAKGRHGREEDKKREDVDDSSSDDDDSSSSSGSSSGGSSSSTDSSSSGSSRSSSSESRSGSESDDSDDGGGDGDESEDENFELSFWESLKAVMPWTEAGKEVRDNARFSGVHWLLDLVLALKNVLSCLSLVASSILTAIGVPKPRA